MVHKTSHVSVLLSATVKDSYLQTDSKSSDRNVGVALIRIMLRLKIKVKGPAGQ